MRRCAANRAVKNSSRCYEYEACKRMYWQVDFHLPEHARELTAYFRFVNPLDEAVPFYWWTNTAVPEEPRARVFSGNKEVIYKKILETRPGGERILAHGSMPFPGGMQKDASYPGSFQSSNEYFFQNEHDPVRRGKRCAMQTGAVSLSARPRGCGTGKCSAGGNHKGGRHWKDFLSDPGKGAYLEIQAASRRRRATASTFLRTRSGISFRFSEARTVRRNGMSRNGRPDAAECTGSSMSVCRSSGSSKALKSTAPVPIFPFRRSCSAEAVWAHSNRRAAALRRRGCCSRNRRSGRRSSRGWSFSAREICRTCRRTGGREDS